jgi:hypothetical protein
MKRTDLEYASFNPFSEDRDVNIECRTVQVVTTRKAHWCAASTLVPPEYKEHNILAGSRAWKESAKVEGDFGTCYCCLPCLDALIRLNE